MGLIKRVLWLGMLALAVVTGSPTLIDTSFNPGSGAGGGIVEQVLPQPDGRILLCGNFTSFNGQNRGYVVRLNSDGSVDSSFLAHPSYWVRNMALQPDGRIVIGGYFTRVAGAPRNLVARLNPDGSLDSSFDPGLGATNIIAGGVDGNIDPFVFWVAVQPDGKILITGNFRTYDGVSSTGIARLNADGSYDSSFHVGGGLDSWGRHIRLLPNGQILLSGWFTSYNGKWANRMARINSDGSPDTTFNPFFGDRTAVYSSALTSDNKIIATGHSLNVDGLFGEEMRRLNWDGSVDTSFAATTDEKTESVLIQPDGKILVAGNFMHAGGAPRTALARFNPNGTLDTGFNVNIDNFVWGMALQPDGKLLIAGGFYNVDGYPRSGVARLLVGATGGAVVPPVKDSPPNLTLGRVSAASLNLTWADTVNSRTGYVIERKSGGAFGAMATLGPTVRSYSVGGLASGSSYTFRVRANNNDGTSIYSNEATGITTAAAGSGGTGTQGSAIFVGADTTTGGSWKGTYGQDGVSIFGDKDVLPAYVRVNATGKSDWVWKWSTQEPAALQRVSGTDRIAACWYSSANLSVDLTFADGLAHRVSAYFLDWDMLGRKETVEVTDGDTGVVLHSQTINGFGRGVYLTWDLSGHVRISITPTGGNTVCSGLFFGPASVALNPQMVATPSISPAGGTFNGPQTITITSATAGAEIRYTVDGTEPGSGSSIYAAPFPVSGSAAVRAKAFKSGMQASATASATFNITTPVPTGSTARVAFIGTDATRGGNWRGTYGSEGSIVAALAPRLPDYAQVNFAGETEWQWIAWTTDTRGLQYPYDARKRIGSCWFGDAITVDINMADTQTHRVSVYLCDWDMNSRSEKVEVLDAATGGVIWSQTVGDFSRGKYLTWDLKGSVKLRFTRVSGANAILNGIFFQPAATQF